MPRATCHVSSSRKWSHSSHTTPTQQFLFSCWSDSWLPLSCVCCCCSLIVRIYVIDVLTRWVGLPAESSVWEPWNHLTPRYFSGSLCDVCCGKKKIVQPGYFRGRGGAGAGTRYGCLLLPRLLSGFLGFKNAHIYLCNVRVDLDMFTWTCWRLFFRPQDHISSVIRIAIVDLWILIDPNVDAALDL